MPVNLLHSFFHRVEKGWDPIPASYAEEYDRLASNDVHTSVVNRLAELAGGLSNKRVLDLGGGPGHYTVLFSNSGARVTWHDISRHYERLARRRAEGLPVPVEFSLGYLEDAAKFSQNPFDLVFCRICWYYSRNDRSFARLMYNLIKPGGIGYVECNTPEFSQPKGMRKLQSWLNRRLWWKIGHPLPPHGRIANLFHAYPISYMELDYASNLRDVVIFVKAQARQSSRNNS